jgi:hypothetical protein
MEIAASNAYGGYSWHDCLPRKVVYPEKRSWRQLLNSCSEQTPMLVNARLWSDLYAATDSSELKFCFTIFALQAKVGFKRWE